MFQNKYNTLNSVKLWLTLVIKDMDVMSEWLLFDANSAIFQLYYGEYKLIYNEMNMRSALY